MLDHEEIEHLQDRLAVQRSNLRHLLLRADRQGGESSASLEIKNAIDESRKAIRDIEIQLKANGVQPTLVTAQTSRSRSRVSTSILIVAIVALFVVGAFCGLIGQQIGSRAAEPTIAALQTSVVERLNSGEVSGEEQAQAKLNPTIDALQTSVALATLQPASDTPKELLDIKQQWRIVYDDDFKSNNLGWDEQKEQYKGDDGTTYKAYITENKFRVEINTGKNGLLSRFSSSKVNLESDFYLEVDVREPVGTLSTPYGILVHCSCGSSGVNYYNFVITNSGYVMFQRRTNGGESANLLPENTKAQINPGETNKLGIIATGSHYALYVNDIKVGEVIDDLIRGGTIGTSSDHNKNEITVIEYDNLKIYYPK